MEMLNIDRKVGPHINRFKMRFPTKTIIKYDLKVYYSTIAVAHNSTENSFEKKIFAEKLQSVDLFINSL